MKVKAVQESEKMADVRKRRREREQLDRNNLQDWYIGKLLAKKKRLAIPTRELPEALILATRLQLLTQRFARGSVTPSEYDAVLAIHRAKYAQYLAGEGP